MQIFTIPCLDDNYSYIIHTHPEEGHVSVVDPGDAAPISRILQERNLVLRSILLTHHHYDHCDGAMQLKELYDCDIIGAKADKHRLPLGCNILVEPTEYFQLGNCMVQVLDSSGHTTGHISFNFINDNVCFCGDAMFSAGCGRIQECTPFECWMTLSGFAMLDPNTDMFFGHEYTLRNLRFARFVMPNNKSVIQAEKTAEQLRNNNIPTSPTSISQELQINPFMRLYDKEILQATKMADKSDPVDIITRLNEMKYVFWARIY